MPLYSYECMECGHLFDELLPFNTPNPECPRCKGKTEKQVAKSTFELRGNWKH